MVRMPNIPTTGFGRVVAVYLYFLVQGLLLFTSFLHWLLLFTFFCQVTFVECHVQILLLVSNCSFLGLLVFTTGKP